MSTPPKPTYQLPIRPNGRRHGWKPDLPDFRDKKFVRTAPALPASIDLRASPFNPPMLDQGQLGSCTAHGGARIFHFDQRKQGLLDYAPSRLQLYYDERADDGTITQDSGAQIRDVIKVIATNGAANEALWPYDITKFTVAPPANAVADALLHKGITYESVDNSAAVNIKNALALGFPVVFGITLYESFESNAVAASGMVPMPGTNESVIGGHCMVIMGYNKYGWIVANSWGRSWGLKGYCYFPIAYLTNTNLASDFWILESVEASTVV